MLYSDGKKQSIFLYAFKTIVMMLAFNFIIALFMSKFVFNSFYFSSQDKIFASIFNEIESMGDMDINSKEFKDVVDICRHNNCTIEVYDSSTNKRIYSPYVYESDIFASVDSKPIFDGIIGSSNKAVVINGINGDSDAQTAINRLNGLDNAYSLLIRKTDNIYILVQTSMATRNSYQSMLSKVMLWCLILSSSMGMIPAYYMQKSMLKNIISIKKVTKRLADHDFSENCDGSRFKEFDELGTYINQMSDSLKQYTYKIEKQNDELLSDIEHRKKLELSQKEFIANVSHELKTPISIISGYAEGIKYGLASSEKERDGYCDTIINECGRMRNIVKQLLDLSVLENLNLDICKNDISEMVNILLEKFRIKYNDRSFIGHVAPDLCADCDYDSMERAVSNYIENAVKYSSGDIVVSVSRIQDNIRIGVFSESHIKKEDENRVWDRFYRVDKSHKRSENSTGLGLSIVKLSMEKHGFLYGLTQSDEGVEFYIMMKCV